VPKDGPKVYGFRKNKKAEYYEGDLILICHIIGSSLEGKGVDIICEVSKLFTNIGFHIIGGNGTIEKLKQIYKSKNLFFYGYVPYKDIPKYLKAFDGFILPNKKNVITANNENIGNYTSPLTNFLNICDTINLLFLSNLDIFKEVLNEDEGFYFESDDINSLKKQIENVFYNGNLKSFKNKQKLKDKYSWEKRVELILLSLDKGKIKE